jgi:DNA-binding LytR/AlgR family response regulator
MKYTCIIVDDEPLAHEVLQGYINGIEILSLVGQFFNAVEAEKYLKLNSIDILFLDIQMPEMSGLELLKRLPEKPITIFTTAFRDFAIEGFELGVMDYLLKPIKGERFNISVNKVIEFLSLKSLETQMIDDKNITRNITIKSGTKTISLPFASITHIQGLKDYSIVYSDENKRYVIKGYLKVMDKIFNKQDFIRVHKSFIVAKTCIKSIDRDKIEIGNHSIPIGRIFKNNVMNVLRSQ